MNNSMHEAFIGALDVSRFVRSIVDERMEFNANMRDIRINFHARIRLDSTTYESLRILSKTQTIVPIWFKTYRIQGAMLGRIEFFGHGVDCFAPFGMRANIIQMANTLHEAMVPVVDAVQNLADTIANLGININEINPALFQALRDADNEQD